jgi:hypothetical protein
LTKWCVSCAQNGFILGRVRLSRTMFAQRKEQDRTIFIAGRMLLWPATTSRFFLSSYIAVLQYIFDSCFLLENFDIFCREQAQLDGATPRPQYFQLRGIKFNIFVEKIPKYSTNDVRCEGVFIILSKFPVTFPFPHPSVIYK